VSDSYIAHLYIGTMTCMIIFFSEVLLCSKFSSFCYICGLVCGMKLTIKDTYLRMIMQEEVEDLQVIIMQ